MHIVLISSTNENNSGWGTITHNHCLALLSKKQSFILLLPKKAKRIVTAYSNNIEYILPNLPLSFNSIKGILQLPLLYKKIKINYQKPAVIHSLLDFPYALLGWHMARRNKLPFIFTAHGTYSVKPFFNLLDKILFTPAYKNANSIIAVSQFTSKNITKVSAYERKINIINNPIAYTKTKIHQNYNFLGFAPPNFKIILSVGPLKPRKGHEILIKAFNEVNRIIADSCLIIIGSGDNNFYKNLIDNDKKHLVFFIPQASSEELAFCFQHCSVFAMLPKYIDHEFEGYGLVYLEAGLYKKPVVGTFSGGVPEAVINGKTGILVSENDEKSTATAIIKILQNKYLAESLGNNGYKLARQRNWDDYINKIIKIYESVCS